MYYSFERFIDITPFINFDLNTLQFFNPISQASNNRVKENGVILDERFEALINSVQPNCTNATLIKSTKTPKFVSGTDFEKPFIKILLVPGPGKVRFFEIEPEKVKLAANVIKSTIHGPLSARIELFNMLEEETKDKTPVEEHNLPLEPCVFLIHEDGKVVYDFVSESEIVVLHLN